MSQTSPPSMELPPVPKPPTKPKAKPLRRLAVRGQLDVHSGYGFLITQSFVELQKAGVFVSLRPNGIDSQFGTNIPKELLSQIVRVRQPEPFELLIYPPTTGLTPERKTIQFTMWESSQLALPNVSLLNRCDAVIVPSQWGKASFKKSGVTRPIYVTPLGFDPAVFHPAPVNGQGPTVFGVAGRVKHCAKRKMIQEAINLWMETFKGVEDVRLHVKIHPDDPIKDPCDKRVKFFRDVMEPYQLCHWLHGLTAYVTLCRAEGFGLWPLQALACGRPVIGCKYAGQADFLTAENGFPIMFTEVTADGDGASGVGYEGTWAQPNLNHAANVLKAIHQNRTMAIKKGAAAPGSVAQLTWEKVTQKLIGVLETRGVFKAI